MSHQRDIWRLLLAEFSFDPEQLELREIIINGTRWKNRQTTLGECIDIEKDDCNNVNLHFRTQRKSVSETSPVPLATQRLPGRGTSVSNVTSATLNYALIPGTNIRCLDCVWDSEYAVKTKDSDTGKETMDCNGYGKKFKARHTTCLLKHFAKKSKGGIGVCTHRYTNDEQIQFDDLLQRSEERKH